MFERATDKLSADKPGLRMHNWSTMKKDMLYTYK